jgi:hypothetical protein
MTSVLSTFEKWKSFLSERVEQAKSSGMGEDMIEKLAFQIGEFLDTKVDPKNEQERVLKELWDVGGFGIRIAWKHRTQAAEYHPLPWMRVLQRH